MMLIMCIFCLLKTLNRYIQLAESLCAVNYVQPYVFQIIEENLYDYGSFFKIWLFLDWFQVMSVVCWLVSVVLDGFRSFQVVSRFSKHIDVLIKNSV